MSVLLLHAHSFSQRGGSGSLPPVTHAVCRIVASASRGSIWPR